MTNGTYEDDMGLGKTISTLALILSRPSPNRRQKVSLGILHLCNPLLTVVDEPHCRPGSSHTAVGGRDPDKDQAQS